MTQLAIKRLSEQSLRKLGYLFDKRVKAKHRWHWKLDVLDLILMMQTFNPHWSNQDIYERVGETFVDWETQEVSDERDWEQSLTEVAQSANLNPIEIAQLRSYLTGYVE